MPGAGPGAGSDNTVSLSIGSSGGVGRVRIFFEPSEEVDKERGIILIVFSISSSKSSKINLSNNIISNSGLFIMIIIFFNNFSSSFKSKIISLLKIIFFLNYTFLNYRN